MFFFMLFLVMVVFMIFNLVMYFFGDLFLILKEKSVSFECGVENFKSSRISFSMQFFFISVIFVLFDMEIIFLMHFMSFLNFWSLVYSIFFSLSFFFFLLWTLLIEWKWNSLKWVF